MSHSQNASRKCYESHVLNGRLKSVSRDRTEPGFLCINILFLYLISMPSMSEQMRYAFSESFQARTAEI